MKKTRLLHFGFTFVELMVVIAIILILSGMSLAAYFQFSQRQAAMNDARNFATMLRRVQAKANNLVYPAGCTGLISYNLVSDCSDGTCQTMSASSVCTVGGGKIIDKEPVLSKIFFTFAVNIDFKAGSGNINPVRTYEFSTSNDPLYKIGVMTDINGNIDVKEL